MHLDKVWTGPAEASCGQAVPRLEGRVDWFTQHPHWRQQGRSGGLTLV
jgi:hypothetical protein